MSAKLEMESSTDQPSSDLPDQGKQKAPLKSQSLGTKSSVIPFIPSSQSLPELTLKAFVLGIILAIVLAGSNAYLGLKMGQTISASIPAAVISMAVLRLFRQSNILENNLVQTIASAGEVVAGAVVFTVPALIVLGYWQTFDYWQVVSMTAIGGVLGVLYSVPLRRALIVESDLKFPEGVAAAEVLKAGSAQKSQQQEKGVKLLMSGALGSAAMQFITGGLHVFADSVSAWVRMGGSVFGLSSGLSLSMLGAGYIVGLKVALNLLLGAFIAWVVIAPLYAFLGGPEAFGLAADVAAHPFAMAIRSAKLRYIGVGTMVLGGLWAIGSLVNPIRNAIASSFHALKMARLGQVAAPARTEHDIPMTWVLAGIALISIPIVLLFNHVLAAANLPLSGAGYALTLVFLTVAALFLGFICASIGGYMAGIVGSSCNPISGVTIGSILIVSISLVLLLSAEITFGVASKEVLSLAAVVIIIGAVVASSSGLSCDNLQDLKAGQLVGSTPWKQQLTLIAGVVAGAMVVQPILELLFQAYGMGGVFPREGMDPTTSLAAPQAVLMASVAQGVFEHKMEWMLILIGIGIGLAVILYDRMVLAKNNSEFRLSTMAVALGLYLPLEVITPLCIGGLVSHFARKGLQKKIQRAEPELKEQYLEHAERRGLLFSAGMIAGEALVGILLAIPFAAYQSTDILAIPFSPQAATVLGTLAFAGFGYYLYSLGSRREA